MQHWEDVVEQRLGREVLVQWVQVWKLLSEDFDYSWRR